MGLGLYVQCRPGRGLSPYQAASWSIQPFSHNTHGPKMSGAMTLLRADGSPSNTHAKFHLDPSNCLATIHRHRETGHDTTDKLERPNSEPFYKRSPKNWVKTNIEFLGCIATYIRRCGLLLQTQYCVTYQSVTVVSPAKMAKPIDMPFGLRTAWPIPCITSLHGVRPHPLWETAILRKRASVRSRCKV